MTDFTSHFSTWHDFSLYLPCGDLSPTEHLSCGDTSPHDNLSHGKTFSTWQIFSPQPPVVMVVTNIRYAQASSFSSPFLLIFISCAGETENVSCPDILLLTLATFSSFSPSWKSSQAPKLTQKSRAVGTWLFLHRQSLVILVSCSTRWSLYWHWFFLSLSSFCIFLSSSSFNLW